MQIGIPKETAPYESRIAATPSTVKKIIDAGQTVVVETGAGQQAQFSDTAYKNAGALITADVFSESQALFCVRTPPIEQLKKLPSGALLIGQLDPHRNPALQDYADNGLHAFALELIPRTLSRAQTMDVLSSQSNLVGYKAVLLAANHYQRPLPMFMTSAGTVKPARVLILGAGVTGLQAIATAKRLGAVVEASDLRPAAQEQVESLGAKWLEVPMSEEEKAKAKDTGGYAWQPSKAYIKAQAEVLANALKNADIVITTAQVPGKAAPVLITAEHLNTMKTGAVLVDIAVESGGNIEGSQIAEDVVTDNGVTTLGTPNLPSTLAAQSSELYANNVLNFFVTLFNDEGELHLDDSDEIQQALHICKPNHVLFNPK